MKKIILLLSCIQFYGCITLPDFITKNEIIELTTFQQKAVDLNDKAIEIEMNNYGVSDSLPMIIELLEQALTIDSTNKTIHYNYLHYLNMIHDSTRMLLASEKLVRSLPDDAGGWLSRGSLLDLYGLNPLEAIECYRRAKILYDKDGDVVNHMLSVLLEGGEESKTPQFIRDFKITLELEGYGGGIYSAIENYDKLKFLRYLNGDRAIYDHIPTIISEEDFEMKF